MRSSVALRFRLGLVFGLTAVAVGCTSPPLMPMSRALPLTPPPRELTALTDGATVSLARKQELIVALDANPTTGYGWTVRRNTDGVLDAIGDPIHAPRLGDPRLVGAGGVTTFRFRAANAGKTALVFTYRRPWESNLPPAKTVRYDVIVD